MRAFEGLEEFEKFKTEVLKHVTGKANKKLAKAFRPSSLLGLRSKDLLHGSLPELRPSMYRPPNCTQKALNILARPQM